MQESAENIIFVKKSVAWRIEEKIGKSSDIQQSIDVRMDLKYYMMRIQLCLIMALVATMLSYGENTVSYSVSDSVVAPGLPKFVGRDMGNTQKNWVDIGFDLYSPEPFVIYKVEWINMDSTKTPLEDFYLDANKKAPAGKSMVWHIDLDFPYTERFGRYDKLKVYTDKGIITILDSEQARQEQEIKNLKQNHDQYVEESEKALTRIWIIVGVLLMVIIAISTIIFIGVRRRLAMRRLEIENLSQMVEERSELNLELREKVNSLYKSRLDTLNMLCNGYFENSDSEKMKEVFYKDVEKQILALRDGKSVEALEEIVNEYLDDTLLKIRHQIPDLTMNDLKFLTYIYAGFSPRAVCIFMNIKTKTFYNRRTQLKERILATDAPDKEFFVSKMFS